MLIDNTVLLVAIVIATVLVSITVHEAMHAFTAHWLGDDTAQMHGRLTLNPLKHIDPFLTVGMPVMLALINAPILGAAKPVPFNPARLKYDEFGAALVAAAGPLTNLALAVFGALVLRLLGGGMTPLVFDITLLFISVNIGFFVFNMIPFPPLDGSRVLYALAPEPLQRVMAQIEAYGLMGFLIFFLLLFRYIAPILGNIIHTITRVLVGI